MQETSSQINSFFESTCVIIVFAYLLTRGPTIRLLGQERNTNRDRLLLSGVFGVVGLAELFFASNRFPYDTYTLIVTFATLQGGFYVGLLTALMVSAGVIFVQSDPMVMMRTVLAILSCVGSGILIRRFVPAVGKRGVQPTGAIVLGTLAAIAIGESAAISIRLLTGGGVTAPFSLLLAIMKIAANGCGAILLQLIIHDAQVRTDAEELRIEAERARTLVAEAKLGALRARIHPHFLFNALTSIASLCRMAPPKAEVATVQLAQIMRRALETRSLAAVPLEDEIEYVKEYIEIEQLRLGSRLHITWKIDANSVAMANIPPFTLQTLVENAIQHGIAPKLEPGTVTITIREYRRHTLIAVSDDGIGIEPAKMQQFAKDLSASKDDADRYHGLQIVTEQLRLLYGRISRLRLFSRPDKGTCVVFALPKIAPTPQPVKT